MTMELAWLQAVLLAASPLAASEPSADEVKKALRSSKEMESVQALLGTASSMAVQWSSGAVLYSILGNAPRNKLLWEPESWDFIFGDPETKDGMFQIIFLDGALSRRVGIKEGVEVIEVYKDRRLASRESKLVRWSAFDYRNCRPVDPAFVDSKLIESKARALRVKPDHLDQFRLALFRPRSDACDGLGHKSRHQTEKPLLKAMRGKSLWVLTGGEETAYFDAADGMLLLRRPLPGTPAAAEMEKMRPKKKKPRLKKLPRPRPL